MPWGACVSPMIIFTPKYSHKFSRIMNNSPGLRSTDKLVSNIQKEKEDELIQEIST